MSPNLSFVGRDVNYHQIGVGAGCTEVIFCAWFLQVLVDNCGGEKQVGMREAPF